MDRASHSKVHRGAAQRIEGSNQSPSEFLDSRGNLKVFGDEVPCAGIESPPLPQMSNAAGDTLSSSSLLEHIFLLPTSVGVRPCHQPPSSCLQRLSSVALSSAPVVSMQPEAGPHVPRSHTSAGSIQQLAGTPETRGNPGLVQNGTPCGSQCGIPGNFPQSDPSTEQANLAPSGQVAIPLSQAHGARCQAQIQAPHVAAELQSPFIPRQLLPLGRLECTLSEGVNVLLTPADVAGSAHLTRQDTTGLLQHLFLDMQQTQEVDDLLVNGPRHRVPSDSSVVEALLGNQGSGPHQKQRLLNERQGSGREGIPKQQNLGQCGGAQECPDSMNLGASRGSAGSVDSGRVEGVPGADQSHSSEERKGVVLDAPGDNGGEGLLQRHVVSLGSPKRKRRRYADRMSELQTKIAELRRAQDIALGELTAAKSKIKELEEKNTGLLQTARGFGI